MDIQKKVLHIAPGRDFTKLGQSPAILRSHSHIENYREECRQRFKLSVFNMLNHAFNLSLMRQLLYAD